MNAPLAKEQIALLMSDNLTYRVSPVQGTDRVGTRPTGFVQRVRDLMQFVAELPRRRAVIDELSRLSDRELADIGLNRANLKFVFTKTQA